ncbi:hypothetical protein RBU49_06735 [Clostridium sp. MB40-C1]|uniref:hypothetical protein n=1 Tax=Clostridium sp. MB40-C1 TaxID=3070996 RepID=UPI0027E0D8B4|nr:hypothetical protein [Clostridium sp. MB40-C1]WMJ81938.1 hypothetical protein RBU49_06735 [Clostridium sp. MB40-C1]
MLRQALERRIGSLSNIEFVTIMAMTTEDIKFNRIRFKKCTSLNYILDIAERSALVLKRCA